MKIIILMILCHVLDDFVFQPIILSKLKQKEFWKEYGDLYKNDYKCALLIHSLSWSGWILVPIIFLLNPGDWFLFCSFIINAAVHYYIDDQKANYKTIDLCTDQGVHLFQILITYLILVL